MFIESIPSEEHEQKPAARYCKNQDCFLCVRIADQSKWNASQNQKIRYQENGFGRCIGLSYQKKLISAKLRTSQRNANLFTNCFRNAENP